MDYTDHIKKNEIFNILNQKEVDALMRLGIIRKYKKGEVLFYQEDSSKETMIVIDGGVRVYREVEDGTQMNISILGKGEILGELSLFDKAVRSGTVETIQPTIMLVFENQNLRAFFQSNPNLAMHIFEVLVKRLRKLHETMEDVVKTTLMHRVWKTLQVLDTQFENKGIKLSQESLADIVGATRARVSEVLKELEREGKIKISYKVITIMK